MTTPGFLNEFTADWPHGHVIVFADGITAPFVVKVTDWPGEFPIRGHVAGLDLPWRSRADGSSNLSHYCLRNAAPPKRVPYEGWVNVYQDISRIWFYKTKEAADAMAAVVPTTRTACVHLREVIEPEPEDKLPEDFFSWRAKKALDNPTEVFCAFKWSSAPQGFTFWSDYHHGSLSVEDTARAREALKRWIAIAEKKGTNHT